MALQMSMNAGSAEPAAEKPTESVPQLENPSASLMQDSEFLASILSSLPGVDASDASIQNVLNSLKGDKKDEKDDKDKK